MAATDPRQLSKIIQAFDAVSKSMENLAAALRESLGDNYRGPEIRLPDLSSVLVPPLPKKLPPDVAAKAKAIADEGVIFTCRGKSEESHGRLALSGDGEHAVFVVLAGSRLNPRETSSLASRLSKARADFLADGTLGADGILSKDVAFSSPSAAASAVFGCSRSGNAVWIDHGTTLGEYLRMKCLTIQTVFPFDRA